jgi:predicted transposase YdaD
MRRDSIFYALFQRSPNLLFELLGVAPDSVSQYRFESVAVKEPKFEIDGVFLPPPSVIPGVVYFCEVQLETISEATGLTIEQIQQLQLNNPNERS